MAEHIPQPVIVADIIADVVAKVAVKSGIAVQFINDTPEQVEARLLKKDAIHAVKYPCIILFHDFPEDNGNSGGYYGTVTIPSIAIAMINSDYNSFSGTRYDKTFRPILYPLYGWFIKLLSQHKDIVDNDPALIRHRKIDHLDWGTQKFGKELNDHVDAIELQNLILTLKQNC